MHGSAIYVGIAAQRDVKDRAEGVEPNIPIEEVTSKD